MKNEYKKDGDGCDMLILKKEGRHPTEITFENSNINIFTSFDTYDSDFNTIPLDDWEEFKAFVDKQIAMKGV